MRIHRLLTVPPILIGAGVAVLLSGCGSSPVAATPAAPAASAAPAAQHESGMVMTTPSAKPGVTSPTVTQALICGEEIRTTVTQVLALKAPPAMRSAFAAGRYSCTYVLPAGPMRLAVQHLASPAAARAYLTSQSRSLGARSALPGLGQGAYGDDNGIVLVLKDDEVLVVDTTALPRVFGAQDQKRTDLAFEIASDVLGCWTGDDS